MSIKICLDAGHHGKYNQSNVVPAYYESDFNWKLYTKLKQHLEEYNIEVTSTRDNQNVEMGTKTRGRYSKGHNAFFSLHANWADRESADHVVIYEMLAKKQHKLAETLATAISKVMGTKEAYDIRTKEKDSGGEWYGVLQGCEQVGNDAGFILEHSFYSNKTMATWMMNDNNIDKLAKEEAKVIAEYFGVSKPEQPAIVFAEGDLVAINKGSRYTTGSKVPSWVINQNWYIKSISGDVAIVDQNEAKNNSISSPVYTKDLTLVAAAKKEEVQQIPEAPKPVTPQEPEIIIPTEPEITPPIQTPAEIEKPVETTPPIVETPSAEPEEEFTPPVETPKVEDEDNGPEAEIDNTSISKTIGEVLLKLLVEFIINPLVKWIKGLFSKGK